MLIKEIENSVDHRPWALPDTKWKYYQEWNRTIFLHWKVKLEDLLSFVPEELEIDMIGGSAWVSLVAFTMERVHLRHLFPFPPISNFDEINIRTYVKSNNRPGVYFLSIEGGKRISCRLARQMSGLPYRFTPMVRTANSFTSFNAENGSNVFIEYNTGQELKEKSELDTWLTERYALFQDSGRHINAFEIHHKAWQLRQLEIKRLELDYPRFNKLIHSKPDKACYSNGVQVIAWDSSQKSKRTIFRE